MRLIDADALIEMLSKKAKTDYEMGLYNHGSLTDSFIRFVERQPTVDAVEVRHGEWEIIEQEDFIYKFCKCSVCGAECFFEEDDKLYNYCPHCGAKMDGERREQ